MIPPVVDDERDGPENAALSVVAGFAEACGIEVRILLHSEARDVLDVIPKATEICDLDAFAKVIGKFHEDLVDHLQQVSPGAPQPVVADDVPRPDVGDLPVLPHTEELKQRFIGRQRWLEDYYSALEGLGERWTRSLPAGRNPVQIFWYHGLGGMGKTTLMRKAMLDTAERYAQAKIAYWEWDRDLWRKPLIARQMHPKTSLLQWPIVWPSVMALKPWTHIGEWKPGSSEPLPKPTKPSHGFITSTTSGWSKGKLPRPCGLRLMASVYCELRRS